MHILKIANPRRYMPAFSAGRSYLVLMLLVLAFLGAADAQEKTSPAAGKAVLWEDPGDVRSRDLFYGVGGKEEQPRPPYRFQSEDDKGANPKFDVLDGNGQKWKVKLGFEARPEIVASRLLWAVGYFANVNYFINDLRVEGMPKQLSRGTDYVDKAGEAFQARLQRKPGKDREPWDWRKNPFVGTREFNGLRVMMALLNNWDLKGENNACYEDKKSGRSIYYVTDVGATFGTSGKSYSDKESKNNIKAYRTKKLIAHATPDHVTFNFPTHPALYHIFNLPYFIHQMRNRWIGHDIPRQDVKWIAGLLAQLTPQQIEDAFRAAGYTPQQIQEYSSAVRARIEELTKL